MSAAANDATARCHAQRKALLDRFEQAWRAGPAPALEAFLPPATDDDPGGRRAVLEELVMIDLEYRWRRKAAGDPALCQTARLEHYMVRHPELGPLDRLSPDLIGAEYKARRLWGDQPGHEEYVLRFARHGGQLAEMLAAIDAEMAAEFAPTGPAGNGPDLSAANGAEGHALASAILAQPVVSATALLMAIQQGQLLKPAQLEELTDNLAGTADSRALARTILQRNWLTPYQINQLLQGRGHDLVLGPYLLLERLGEGGAGQVFKARHRKMDRVVALKFIRRELLAEQDAVRRFYREIHVLSRLMHPNVVHAFDAGPAGATHFLAMEYVEGTDLGRLVKQGGPLPILQTCAYIRQAALGLQHAHERGLVHRDIKPHNLIVSVRDGLVKVADLGLARLCRTANGEVTAALTMAHSAGALTPQNAVMMGTADYLAPEQALDFHRADIRADIYSLGCTFYYLLTGQPPFAGNTLAEKLIRHQQAEPPPLDHCCPQAPPELALAIRRMLAKDPKDRYQTPAEVAAALAPLLQIAASTSGSAVAPSSANSPTRVLKGPDLAPGVLPLQRRQRRRRTAALAAAGRLGLGNPQRDGMVLVPADRTTRGEPGPS